MPICENWLLFLRKCIAAFPTSLNGFLLELQTLFLGKIFLQSVSMINSVNLNFCFQLFRNFLLPIAFLFHPLVFCFQFQIFVGYYALSQPNVSHAINYCCSDIFFLLAKFCFHLIYYQSTAKISLVKNLRRQGYNSQLQQSLQKKKQNP